MAVFPLSRYPLAYLSGEFEWLIHSGHSGAVVLAKPTAFELAT